MWINKNVYKYEKLQATKRINELEAQVELLKTAVRPFEKLQEARKCGGEKLRQTLMEQGVMFGQQAQQQSRPPQPPLLEKCQRMQILNQPGSVFAPG